MKKFNWAEKILEKTNGGLDIIKDYFPEVDESKPNKFFKIRDEKTASASIKFINGKWLVQDWGDWDRPKNAIELCMFLENLSFPEACKTLAERYNVSYDGKLIESKPVFSKRKNTEQESPGNYINLKYKDFLDAELKVIGKNFNEKVAKKYNFKSVESYEYVKDEKTIFKFESTPQYPIFAFDMGKWKKIYQPKAKEKKNRFRYIGGRPENFVFGLEQIKEEVRKLREIEEEKEIDDKTRNVDVKLEKIIIASGDRDALNLASFGYHVIWLNSETADFTSDLYNQLTDLADKIYNLPDIDHTGIKQGRKLAFKFLEIKTIWLPDILKIKRDHRGNSCKDFTDFVHHFFHPQVRKRFVWLHRLVENALPMKFWDEVKTEKGMRYYYNLVHSYHFLEHSGFYRILTPNGKDPYIYIHLNGNIVTQVTANYIENYVKDWLEKRMIPIPIRNMVLKSAFLKDAHLSKLKAIEIDFTNNTKRSQFWFFKKFTAEITKDGMTLYNSGKIPRYVWDYKILDLDATKFQFDKIGQQFRIFKDKSANWDIEILEKNNDFLNFLINTSRIHWRSELERKFINRPERERKEYFKQHQFDIAGPNLDDDEVYEQKLHLINKIFALGYMLHRYKDRRRTWFVYAMDNKIADASESHGGSGKSFSLIALKKVLKNQFYIPGRNRKATQNEFIYDGVTEDTDYIFIDDMNQYFDFQFLFSDITESIKVNPKHTKPFTLEFEKAPKMCGSSNFPPMGMDPSTQRRLLFMVLSDWYHENKDDEYRETRTISDDFGGKELFRDWNPEQWMRFYKVMQEMLTFFLQTNEKIDPPMENVKRRNFIAEMGDTFKDWAEVFFSPEKDNLNRFVRRDLAYKDFKDKTGSKKSPQNFKKSLKAFAKLNGYEFNPEELRNDKGRIMRRTNTVDGHSKVVEMIFIKTPNVPAAEKNMQEVSEADENEIDELPF